MEPPVRTVFPARDGSGGPVQDGRCGPVQRGGSPNGETPQRRDRRPDKPATADSPVPPWVGRRGGS
jgi:hypothetical protein